MRRLIVLCDGTGQSAVRGEASLSTNIKKLGDCISWEYEVEDQNGGKTSGQNNKPTKSKHPQIVYYQSGVGTGGNWSSKAIAKGTGDGINENVLDAYLFLCNNYIGKDDEILIFGFSRGAYTARILANLVLRLGLFQSSYSSYVRRAWSQYMVDDKSTSFDFFLHKLEKINAQFIKDEETRLGGPYTGSGIRRKVRVKVLGVWDTVGALGLPDYAVVENVGLGDNNSFYDTRLHYGTEYVFHALALDEYRMLFGPTLFHLPDPKTRGDMPEITLKQCWFAGAHTDIGGGYASEHQSNITLAWMIDQLRQYNLLDIWTGSADKLPSKYERIVIQHHNPAYLAGCLHAEARKEANCELENPGWGCGKIRDSFGEMRFAVSWQYRAPGNYITKDSNPGQSGKYPLPGWDTVQHAFNYAATKALGSWWSSSSKTSIEGLPMCLDPDCSHPQTHWNQKGGTNETIHASVYARVRAVQQGKLLVIPGLDKQGKPKPYAGKETWDPKSLAMFRQPEHTTAYPCYFREATTDEPTELKVWKQKKGGQDISPNQFAWYGRCYKSKKFFQMYEEPDEGFKYPTMMSELKNSFSITAAKKDMEKNMRHWEILDDGFCLKEWREKPENKQEWEAYAKENLIDVKGGGWLSRLF